MSDGLLPRLAGCLPSEDAVRLELELWLRSLNLCSVLRASSWFDSVEDFVAQLPLHLREHTDTAKVFFVNVEKMTASVLRGGARADMSGPSAPSLWPSSSQGSVSRLNHGPLFGRIRRPINRLPKGIYIIYM